MCVSPVRIKNPNCGVKTPLIQATADTISQYINVPCGVCSECVSLRQLHFVQRCRVLSMDHYIFFVTLTYNQESLPIYPFTDPPLPFADIADVQRMFKRIRKAHSFPDNFLYFFVSERGSRRARPHFHGLIFIPKNKNDDSLRPAQLESQLYRVVKSEWKRNYGSNRVPIWKPLFTYKEAFRHGQLYRNFDLHYVVPHSTEHGSQDVAFYVSKYLLKASNKEIRLQQALKLNYTEEEYNEIWNFVKSRSFWSKNFGAATDLEKNFVRSSILRSASDEDGFKMYFNDGSTQPLSKYYRKFIDADSAIKSVAARGGPFVVDDRSSLDKVSSIKKGALLQDKVRSIDVSQFYPE